MSSKDRYTTDASTYSFSAPSDDSDDIPEHLQTPAHALAEAAKNAFESALSKADGDEEEHIVGPFTNGASIRLEGDEVRCQEAGEVYDINADIESAEPLGECPGCGDDLGNLVKSVSKDGNPWKPYEGPSGGEGWQHAETGEIRYQEEQPEPGEGGVAETYQPVIGDEFDPLGPPPGGYGVGWDAPPEDWREMEDGSVVEIFVPGEGYAEATLESTGTTPGDKAQYVSVVTTGEDEQQYDLVSEDVEIGADDGTVTAYRDVSFDETWDVVEWEGSTDAPLNFDGTSQVVMDGEEYDVDRVSFSSGIFTVEGGEGETFDFEDVDAHRPIDPKLTEMPDAEEIAGIEQWDTSPPESHTDYEYGDMVVLEDYSGEMNVGEVQGYRHQRGQLKLDSVYGGVPYSIDPGDDNVVGYADIGEHPLEGIEAEFDPHDIEENGHVEIATVDSDGEASTVSGEVKGFYDKGFRIVTPEGEERGFAYHSAQLGDTLITEYVPPEEYDPFAELEYNGMEMDADAVSSGVLRDIDLTTTDDYGRLPRHVRETIQEELTDFFPSQYVEQFYSRVSTWKGNSDGSEAQRHERSFKEALGIDSPYRAAGGSDEEPTDYEVKMAKVASELSREYWEEHHDGEAELHRGISNPALEHLMDDWLENPDVDGVELSHLALNNYTTREKTANGFGGDSAVVTNSVSTDEVGIATDAMFNTGGGHAHETEVGVIGDEQHVGMSDVQFMDGKGFSLDSDFSELSQHEMDVLGDYFRDYYYGRATGENDLGEFSESQFETLLDFTREAKQRDLNSQNQELVDNIEEDAEELYGLGHSVRQEEFDVADIETGQTVRYEGMGGDTTVGEVVQRYPDDGTVRVEDDFGMGEVVYTDNIESVNGQDPGEFYGYADEFQFDDFETGDPVTFYDDDDDGEEVYGYVDSEWNGNLVIEDDYGGEHHIKPQEIATIEGDTAEDLHGEGSSEPTVDDYFSGDTVTFEADGETLTGEVDAVGFDQLSVQTDDGTHHVEPEDIVDDAEPETSEPSEGPSWSEWTADYDMTEYNPSDVQEWGGLSDFGFPSGVTAHNMQVGSLESWDGESNEGLVFKTNYGVDGEKTDLGHRQMVTYTLGEDMGANMPVHTGHPEEDGYVVAEGIEGDDIGSAPDEYIEQVDEDDWYEQAAYQIILGNNDAHMQNVKVTPDGDVVFHDIDHSAGSITGDFVGNKPSYEDAIDRVLGELYRSAKHVVDGSESEVKQRMLEVAEERATEFYTGGIEDGFDRAGEYDSDLRDNVMGNIIALKNGEVNYE